MLLIRYELPTRKPSNTVVKQILIATNGYSIPLMHTTMTKIIFNKKLNTKKFLFYPLKPNTSQLQLSTTRHTPIKCHFVCFKKDIF